MLVGAAEEAVEAVTRTDEVRNFESICLEMLWQMNFFLDWPILETVAS